MDFTAKAPEGLIFWYGTREIDFFGGYSGYYINLACKRTITDKLSSAYYWK